ncbi:response regulator transcription factor [Halopseudomonas nanhaiensis]|uniref:response regulator transcription factor n=1 Tax=Halopseudomonas nanhaiensis TaxID=2830842 RepID=UPI001CBD3AD6|nr:response regulator transcription factor [Halopseudomonas nanhaiensis]UAW97139.1 response regulator transcription factor [Halopseudomonas nanhaiensis]
MRLLLAEDNVALADALCSMLRAAGYVVDWRTDGRDVKLLGEIEPYDVCVLDLGLPGLSGLDILRAWRTAALALPVLVLTARGSWSERVEGLRAGADDYLPKPFHEEELLLRLQNLLRRANGSRPGARLSAVGLELDEQTQHVRTGEADIPLSGAEFRLLRYFMLNAGQVLSKSRLAEHLYDHDTERDSNVIEVLVNHLRRKLGRDAIETRRGQGYVLKGLMP